MKKLLGACALLTVSLPFISMAQEYPAPIESMRSKGIEIVDTFTAPDGLDGYAAMFQGRPLAIYLTPDKQHAIIGTLFNAQGDDLTNAVIEDKVARPQSKVVWEALQKSYWISEGSKKAEKVVYIFSDPNCRYCKELWKATRPWVDGGKVELRHVMVGILGESSQKKAAYLLSVKNPGKALADNESGKVPAKELDKISEAQRKQLDENLELMASMGITGTPAVLYLDDTGLLNMQPGLAQGEQLTEIFGPRP